MLTNYTPTRYDEMFHAISSDSFLLTEPSLEFGNFNSFFTSQHLGVSFSVSTTSTVLQVMGNIWPVLPANQQNTQ